MIEDQPCTLIRSAFFSFRRANQLSHSHQLDPLVDPRWHSFVLAIEQSSVFHSAPWLKTLHVTYGFIPEVYTTSSTGHYLQASVVIYLLMQRYLTVETRTMMERRIPAWWSNPRTGRVAAIDTLSRVRRTRLRPHFRGDWVLGLGRIPS